MVGRTLSWSPASPVGHAPGRERRAHRRSISGGISELYCEADVFFPKSEGDYGR